MFEFLKISKKQLLVFSLIAMFIVLVSNTSGIVKSLGLSQLSRELSMFWEDIDYLYDLNSVWTNLSSVVFWMFFGVILYLLFWALSVFIVDSYNDVIVSKHFIHPESFRQSSYWFAVVLRALLRLTGVAIITLMVLWLLTDGIAFIGEKSIIINNNLSVAESLVGLLISVFIITMLLYLTAIALRIAVMKKRVFMQLA